MKVDGLNRKFAQMDGSGYEVDDLNRIFAKINQYHYASLLEPAPQGMGAAQRLGQ